MNNINKASKDIKKKLSLNDYSMPVRHKRQTEKTVKQHSVKDTPEISSTKTDLRQSDLPVTTSCHNTKSACRHDMIPKIKSTYYLNSEANNQFTEVYINRLKNNKKIDRSSLICEAIKLLYSNEF